MKRLTILLEESPFFYLKYIVICLCSNFQSNLYQFSFSITGVGGNKSKSSRNGRRGREIKAVTI